MAEWLKATDCKSVQLTLYAGSNPALPTSFVLRARALTPDRFKAPLERFGGVFNLRGFEMPLPPWPERSAEWPFEYVNMTGSDPERTFQRSLQWYVPILVACCVVAYMHFFPVGQRPWMSWVSTSVESIYAIATIAYAVLCVRAIKARKEKH